MDVDHVCSARDLLTYPSPPSRVRSGRYRAVAPVHILDTRPRVGVFDDFGPVDTPARNHVVCPVVITGIPLREDADVVARGEQCFRLLSDTGVRRILGSEDHTHLH